MLNFQDIRSKYPGADSLTDDQLIGVFADKYGTTPEVFKQAIDYQPPPGESAGAAFKRGAVESFKQLPQLGYGVLAGAGAVAENIAGEGGLSTGLKNFAVKKYEEKSADIAKGAQANDEFSTAYDKAKAGDIGALGDWLAHGLGYVGGQAVQMVGTAGVGSLAGKVAAKGIAENLASSLVSKEAAAIAASEAGAKLSAEAVNRMAVSKVAGQIGEQAALAGTSFGMEGGEIFGDLVQKATKEGRQLTGDDLFRAGVGTTVAGLLEYGEKLTGLAAMKGKLPLGGTLAEATGFGGRFARGVAGASMAAPLEYGQEFGQTLAEEYGKGDDPFSEASFKQAKNAAALGALGGSAHGIIGGALTGAQPKTPQQAVNDIANAPDVDSAIKAAEEAVNAGPKFDQIDFLVSLNEIKSKIKENSILQKLRDAGDAGTITTGDFLNALSVANNPVVRMDQRELARDQVSQIIEQLSSGTGFTMPGAQAEPAPVTGTALATQQGGELSAPIQGMQFDPNTIDGQSRFVDELPGQRAIGGPRALTGPTEDGSIENAPVRTGEPKQPGALSSAGPTDAEVAAADASYQGYLERERDQRRKEDQDASSKQNAWAKRATDWFSSANDGDSIEDSDTGVRYVVHESVKERKGQRIVFKGLFAINADGTETTTGITMRDGVLQDVGKAGLDEDGIRFPTSETFGTALGLGKGIEDGTHKTSRNSNSPAQAQAAPSKAPKDAGKQSNQASQAEDFLTSPTREDILAKQQAEEDAAKAKEAADKAKAALQQDDTAENAIRKSVDDSPHKTIGSWHPISVTHNGVTQQFLFNIKRIISDGKGPQVIHLKQIKEGRIISSDDKRPLVHFYKLDRSNSFDEEGIPRYADDRDLKQWANAFNAGLTAPTPAEVIAQQDRKDNAQALDDKAQIDAEAQLQTLTMQTAPDQRQDNTSDMFGEDKAKLEAAKREADAIAKNEAAKDPNQSGMFDEPAAQATAILDAAEVKGKERIDVLKDVKSGTITPEEVKAAYPAKEQAEPEAAAPKIETPGVIEDVGEKLEGGRVNARKALSKEFTDGEIASLPLSKIWAAEEIDAIEDDYMAAFSFAARQEVPSKPRVAYRVKSWVEKVKMLRGLALRVIDGTLTKERFQSTLGEFRGLEGFKAKVELLEGMDRANWKRIGSVAVYPDAYRYNDAGAKELNPLAQIEIDGRNHTIAGVKSIEEALPKVQELLGGEAPEKRMPFEVRGRAGAYSINKKGDSEYRKLKTFATSKEAFDYIKDNYADLVAAWDGVKERDNVKETDVRSADNKPRTGKEWRKGNDVSSSDFMRKFGFRGVEFGSWVEQGKNAKERQGMINQAYDALMDLADILGVPPKALSLNGSLGIGFGSRGSGWASAHFEPGNLVINLTKTRGAGSLAHEFFHALDNYFARQRGGEVPMAHGMNAQDAYRANNFITYRPEPMMVRKDGKGTPMSKVQLARYSAQNPTSKYYNAENWQVDPRHPNGVRPEVEQAFADLVQALDDSPMKGRSANIDKSPNGYWSRILERAARAFENYTILKMRAKGFDNDYLANVREVQDFPRAKDRYPYLLPEEAKPIADAFEVLFNTIQTREDDSGNVAMYSRGPVNQLKINQSLGEIRRMRESYRDSPGLFNDLVRLASKDYPGTDIDSLSDEQFAEYLVSHKQSHPMLTSLAKELVDAGWPKHNAQDTAAVAQVQNWVNQLSAKWKNGPEIQVVSSIDDLPVPAASDTRGLYYRGTVYLVASRIGSKKAAGEVLAHESIAHFGLREMLGESDWYKFMRQMQTAIKSGNKPLNAIRDQIRSVYVDENGKPNLTEIQEADEIAAKSCEMAIDPKTGEFNPGFGFLKSVFAKVAQFLRDVGFDVKFTNLELQGALVNAMRNLEVGNRTHGGAVSPAVAAREDAQAARNDQTQTPEFKRWFGDSVVTDNGKPMSEGGKPLVVYHGTTADVESFDLSFSGSDGVGYSSPAIFATSDSALASDYALNKFDRVIADAVRALQKHKNENPSDYVSEAYEALYSNVKKSFAEVSEQGRRETGGGANVMPLYMSMQNPLVVDGEGKRFMQVMPDAIAKAVAGGHDGIIVNRVIDNASPASDYPAQIFIAFRPEQIKSATGNNGNFDPTNPDIRFARGTNAPVTNPNDVVGNQGGRSADDTTPGGTHPFNGFTREQFLGNPKITSDANAKDLVPSTWKSLESEKNVPFAIGSGLTARYSELSAAVYNEKGDVVASYSFGDTLVVNKKYRRQGIGSELVYQWRMRNPNSKTAATRTKKSQLLQEKVWNRIRSERALYESRIHQDSNESTAPDSFGAPMAARSPIQSNTWNSPSTSKFDNIVYTLQNKQIDTKRVVEAIKQAGKDVAESVDVYLREELFHGRSAKRTEDFLNNELTPLLTDMKARGISLEQIDKYLHARHAEEANKVIASRNPDMPDGGSGMKTQDAKDYLNSLGAAERNRLDAVAKKIDGMIATTRQLYADEGLESQETVDSWGAMFKHYVPLMREDKDGGMGIGQGFSIKGKESKGRVGSSRAVVDILANIAMQREKVIVRGEKNRVATALVGLATENPNPDFWTVGETPHEKVYDPKTNSVVDRIDPMYKSRENVVVAKVKQPDGNINEVAVVFNEDNDRAVRMAASLKNLDALQLNGLLGISAKISRYISSINTQYNPIFGIVNLARDVQGAMVNLSTTELKGQQKEVSKHVLSALKGVYLDARAVREGKTASSKWAALNEEFQNLGGQTGYRDLFATSEDRAKALQNELMPYAWMDGTLGKVFTANGMLKVPMSVAQDKAKGLFDWLSDYNLAMENAVRLSAYKVGIDQGMSKERAASLAKNLTVNFNRKGQISQQAGALYAFFNAGVQGTARLSQVLFEMDGTDPRTIRLSATGKKVVAGGIMLGVAQAVMLAAAGFGDDDPPEFVRERNLIIPTGWTGATGDKAYITIPMPLGLHVLPNIGRVSTEFALGGFRDPVKRAAKLFGLFTDAFNPMGGGASLLQILSPTPIDPLVALAENKDGMGRTIAKTSRNPAVPGFTLAKDTASKPAKMIAEAINFLSGGTEYKAGVLSPTPDQVDFLIGQATGGVGREISKGLQTASAMYTGEELPTHKIPLVGRFYGDSDLQSAQSNAFYSAVKRIEEHELEIKGLRKDGKSAELTEYMAENPEARLVPMANRVEIQIQNLQKRKRELMKNDADAAQIKAVENQITERMKVFNMVVRNLREKQPA